MKLMFHTAAFFMYLLYLDDAGSVKSPSERFFILAGIAIFERQVYFLDKEMSKLAVRIAPSDCEHLEFHGNEMQSGRKLWRKLCQNKDGRRTAIRHALATARSLQGEWCLFASVVEKVAVPEEDPIEYAFEQIISRFDHFLRRKYQEGNQQRGLIIMDESTRETRLQTLAQEFRSNGHRWGVLRNMVDVPFFVDSKATRLVQYADLVAYALWRKFEHGDSEFFDVIDDAFDTEGDTCHGLHVRIIPASAA